MSMHWCKLLLWVGLCLTAAHQGWAAGAPTKVIADRVNVRGQASLRSEVITQLREGETVNLLKEIELSNPEPGEPVRWAQIELPANTPVWAARDYIDPATKTVKADRLNVRGGPGTNFSIVGQLLRGQKVKEIRSVQEWMEIEPPEGATSYVAARFLEATARPGDAEMAEAAPSPGTSPSTSPGAPEPPRSSPAVPAGPAIATETPIIKPPRPSIVETTPAPIMADNTDEGTPGTAPVEPSIQPSAPAAAAPAAPEFKPPRPPKPPVEVAAASPSSSPVPVPEPASVPEPAPEPAPAPAMPDPAVLPDPAVAPEPFDPDVVRRREVVRVGVVRRTFSIQAPTHYQLIDPQTRHSINYLYAGDTGLQLKYYSGQKIKVSGEESLDKRWPNKPLIHIKTLEPLP